MVKQNSLVMVMDNKGPQETKMEPKHMQSFPWWLSWVSPTHLKHMHQVKFGFHFPQKSVPVFGKQTVFLWLQGFLDHQMIDVSTRKHGIPKSKVVFPTINLQVLPTYVSFRNRSTKCRGYGYQFWHPIFESLSHVFGSNPNDPKLTRNTTCFIVKFARFISKSILWPLKCGWIQ